MLKMLTAHGVKAPAPHLTVKKAREQMLGGMFDADVQSRWRDSCALDCGHREMQAKI